MTDRFAPYLALTPPGRLVAMAFGVVHPHALTPVQVAQLLADAGFHHESRRVSKARFKAFCKEVAEADIAFGTGNRGRMIASPDWAPWLTLKAFREKKLGRIESIFRPEIPPT